MELINEGSSNVITKMAADSDNNRIQVFSASFAGSPELHNFIGFDPPVYNPPVVNVAKAGSAVPVKFTLDGYNGINVLLGVQEISCDSLLPLDGVEETVAVGSRGRIEEYRHVWKTKKAWAGSCRQLIVTLYDGTEYMAYFDFR